MTKRNKNETKNETKNEQISLAHSIYDFVLFLNFCKFLQIFITFAWLGWLSVPNLSKPVPNPFQTHSRTMTDYETIIGKEGSLFIGIHHLKKTDKFCYSPMR